MFAFHRKHDVGDVKHSIPRRSVTVHVDDDVDVMLVVENDDDASASSPRPCRSAPESDCLLLESVNPFQLRDRLHQTKKD
jgi:hypothetical protein